MDAIAVCVWCSVASNLSNGFQTCRSTARFSIILTSWLYYWAQSNHGAQMPCRLYSVLLLPFTFILSSSEREARFESHRHYAVQL